MKTPTDLPHHHTSGFAYLCAMNLKRLRHFSALTSLVLLPLILVIFTSSCSEYNKVLKSNDLDLKFTKAEEYYNEGEYIKALPLFEELRVLVVGTQRAEKINYYFAWCHYKTSDYYLAGYFFKQFTRTYANSQHAEECAFMSAYCYYRNSPKYSLDQQDTKRAIEEMQLFVNRYPASELVDSCNNLIDNLRGKLDQKTFEMAQQYFHMEQYKSAAVSFDLALKEFPNSAYKEDMLFLTVKSNYLLAINSVESKKEERLRDTLKSYRKFVDSYQKSEFMREVEMIYRNTNRELEKINAQ